MRDHGRDHLPSSLDTPSTAEEKSTVGGTYPQNRRRSYARARETGDARYPPYLLHGRDYEQPSLNPPLTAPNESPTGTITHAHGQLKNRVGASASSVYGGEYMLSGGDYTTVGTSTSARGGSRVSSWASEKAKVISPWTQYPNMPTYMDGPTSPYFYPQHQWSANVKLTAFELERVRNQLSPASIVAPSVLMGIIEQHFPTLDSTAPSRAGANQVRAKAYASITLALAWVASHI